MGVRLSRRDSASTQDSTRAAADRDPRLVLRFAIAIGVCLTLAAIAIILVIRYLNVVEAEKNAGRHARFVAHALLNTTLEDADFGTPLPTDRRFVLDRMLRKQVLVDGTLLVALVRPDGTIAYASDPAAEATLEIDRRRVAEALEGTITSTDDELRLAGTSAVAPTAKKVLVSYVAASSAGIAILYQDYKPIADAANAAFLPVAGTLELVVVVLFLLLVPILSRVTKRLRLQLEQIRHQAEHDDLTGLPNRSRFRELVAELLEAGPVSVMLLDLDGFKEVNDALGHDVGDELLREIPSRLAPAIPTGATLARLGGDEFAVLLPLAARRDPTEIAATIRTLLDTPFGVRGLSLAVNASIGVAVAPQHGSDAETLLKNADIAMYEAKRAQTGWSVYDPARDPNDPAKVALTAELRGAFAAGEIAFLYQPKLDLRTGEIVGAEALARWQHPTHGTLGPEVWLGLAERAGLHDELVHSTVTAVASEIRAWDSKGIRLRVSLNLTMLDLLDLGLPGTIARILGQQGVDPSQVDLEITEGVFMSNPDRVRRVLTTLSEMGTGLAIDDYGTGYSSLAYLSSLPVDELKIDRSFVSGILTTPRNHEIVRSTIQLGHSLGLRVVAEGVETEEELAHLRELGCDLAQGYFVGRPVTASALTTRLLEQGAPLLRLDTQLPPAEPRETQPVPVPTRAVPPAAGPIEIASVARPLRALERLRALREELGDFDDHPTTAPVALAREV